MKSHKVKLDKFNEFEKIGKSLTKNLNRLMTKNNLVWKKMMFNEYISVQDDKIWKKRQPLHWWWKWQTYISTRSRFSCLIIFLIFRKMMCHPIHLWVCNKEIMNILVFSWIFFFITGYIHSIYENLIQGLFQESPDQSKLPIPVTMQ